jgi:hypothetical protein
MEQRGLLKAGKKLVVAISGPSGSGKTEIGYCIGAYLGVKGFRSVCYSTDNCYVVPPIERGQKREEAFQNGTLGQIINSKEYNWPLISSIENAVREGRIVETPVVDITKDDRPIYMKNIDYSEFDVLLLDGLYAFDGSADVRVCLEQTWEGVMEAQRERGKEVVNPIRLSVLKLELEEVLRIAVARKEEVIVVSPGGEVRFPQ